MDLARMRRACEDFQWSVDDVDWDAPGHADRATAESLRGFLSDVVWVEYVAEPIFTAMADNVTDPDLQAIYRSFSADERRHADAELELMVRWGLLRRGEMPSPNVNIRTLHRQLSKHSAAIHPSVLVAVIPMLELLLDGALIRFLMEASDDPVLHSAFARINRDESRHLAVDFYVLETDAQQYSTLGHARNIVSTVTNRHILWALFFGFIPYLGRARLNLEAMGLDYANVRRMLRRYVDLGDDNPAIARNPCYRAVRLYAAKLARGDFVLEDMLARLSDAVAKVGRPSRFFRST